MNLESGTHIWTGGSIFVPLEFEVQSRHLLFKILSLIEAGRQIRCILGSLLFTLCEVGVKI